MCHKIGASPISTIGFGLIEDSSLILEPLPPANMTTFTFIRAFPSYFRIETRNVRSIDIPSYFMYRLKNMFI